VRFRARIASPGISAENAESPVTTATKWLFPPSGKIGSLASTPSVGTIKTRTSGLSGNVDIFPFCFDSLVISFPNHELDHPVPHPRAGN
jgi:hypothetical protein